MARTKQTGRRDKAKAKKPAKKEAAKLKPSEQPFASKRHENELPNSTKYRRCDRERFDLSTEGTSFADLTTKPPQFVRGFQITSINAPKGSRILPLSSDKWAPDHLKKPTGYTGTWKQLCTTWASEMQPALLKKCEDQCVWGWRPGKPQPSWWRLDYHEDDTYRVLCFCFSRNFRCYQPLLGVDFSEFCEHALKGDNTAKALMAINRALKEIGQTDFDAKHKEKPTECDDRCTL